MYQHTRFNNKNNKKISEILAELPTTYQSPTMAPYCKDSEKYDVVENLVKEITNIKAEMNIKMMRPKISICSRFENLLKLKRIDAYLSLNKIINPS